MEPTGSCAPILAENPRRPKKTRKRFIVFLFRLHVFRTLRTTWPPPLMPTLPPSQCRHPSCDTFFRRSKGKKLLRSPTVVAWRLDDVPCAKQPCHDYSTGVSSARGRRWPPPAPLDSSPSETPESSAPCTWTSVFCAPYPSGNRRRPGDFGSPWTRIS